MKIPDDSSDKYFIIKFHRKKHKGLNKKKFYGKCLKHD